MKGQKIEVNVTFAMECCLVLGDSELKLHCNLLAVIEQISSLPFVSYDLSIHLTIANA